MMESDRLQQFVDLRLSFVGLGIGGFTDFATAAFEKGEDGSWLCGLILNSYT